MTQIKHIHCLRKSFIFFLALLVLYVPTGLTFAQDNSLRVVYYRGDFGTMPDNYLDRIVAAGYTHVMMMVPIDDSNEWASGIYVGQNTKEKLTAAFLQAHNHGLRLVPLLHSANRHGDWHTVNNPDITYQPIVNKLLMGQLAGSLEENSLPFRIINGLFNLTGATEKTTVSQVPNWSPEPNGYDKSWTSLVEDLIKPAFEATGLPSEELDYIHIGYDEPYIFNSQVDHFDRLLIGKSQRDLRWIYDHMPDHGGVSKFSVAPITSFPRTLFDSNHDTMRKASTDNRGLWVESNYLYLANYSNSAYRQGLNGLIADHLLRRVEEIERIFTSNHFPKLKFIVFADLFDPESYGGDYGLTMKNAPSASALELLRAKQVHRKLVLMPWYYTNTFRKDPILTEVDAKEDTTKKVVIAESAKWLGCAALAEPIAFTICRLIHNRYIYETIKNTKINVQLTYDGTGKRYDAKAAINEFVTAEFQFAYIHALQDQSVYPDTLTQLFKILDSIKELDNENQDKYVLGYSTVMWHDDEDKWVWNSNADIYQQVAGHNIIELTASLTKQPQTLSISTLFGELVTMDANDLYIDKRPESNVDYLAVARDTFNPMLDTVNSPRAVDSFGDAVFYCNRLSIREGREPVYLYDRINFVDHIEWGRDIVHNIDNLRINPDANGYRVPTANELKAMLSVGRVERAIGPREWVTSTDVQGRISELYYEYDSGSVKAPRRIGQIIGILNPPAAFRVVRQDKVQRTSLNQLVTFTRDVNSYRTYLSGSDNTPTYTSTEDAISLTQENNTQTCSNEFVGKFTFNAILENSKDYTLTDINVEIEALSGGNMLLKNNIPLKANDQFSIPQTGDYQDGELKPGESVIVPFTVCLASGMNFNLLVNIVGNEEVFLSAPSMIQSSFGPEGNNLEVIAREADGLLHHYFRKFDKVLGIYVWNEGSAPFVLGATSAPSLVQSTFRPAGNTLEVVVRGPDRKLHHYVRQFDDGLDRYVWIEDGEPFAPESSSSPALIQSTFDGVTKLEVVVREGDMLQHYFRKKDKDGIYRWKPGGGAFANNVTSAPAFIQSNFGVKNDNYEVLVRQADNKLHHYFRRRVKGEVDVFEWIPSAEEIPAENVTSAPTLIQNEDGFFEVMVRQADNKLHHYFRRPDDVKWRLGGVEIPISNVMSAPSLIQSSDAGNLEVVVREGKLISHYFRRNADLTWNLGDDDITD